MQTLPSFSFFKGANVKPKSELLDAPPPHDLAGEIVAMLRRIAPMRKAPSGPAREALDKFDVAALDVILTIQRQRMGVTQ